MEPDLDYLVIAAMASAGGIAVGLVIGLLYVRSATSRLRTRLSRSNDQLRRALASAKTHNRELTLELATTGTQLNERQSELVELRKRLDALGDRYQAVQNEHTRLRTREQERESHHAEQIRLLNEARDNLKRDFENLANRIFEDKGRNFTRTNQASLEALLQPFREQISGFQSRINEVHAQSLRGQTALESEIRKVLEIGLEMNSQASNLAVALKGDKKTTGNWGEAQLQQTLELAGLIPGEHYETQAAFRDQAGRRRLPDFLIKLPDAKSLVIDSKVSLVDYDRAIAAETEEARAEAMSAHARAVRNHIDDLSAKDYARLPGIDSPDFVLMFMPIEPAYIEAMKHNRELFDYGYRKGVVMVSHTTLMPILRTVANLWMVEQSNREAKAIAGRAGEIYNQVCLVAERLSRLGNTLRAANNHYNETVRGLAGQQGLHGKVDRFRQLSAKASRQMAEPEPIHPDLETERLENIGPATTAEPVARMVESPRTNPDGKAG